MAGYNAARGTYFGAGIEFDTFQKLAGALHYFDSMGKELDFKTKLDIVVNGTAYGPAPAYGEIMYQYRMSKEGWADSKASQ